MSAVKMGLTIEEAAECTGIGRNTMRKLVEWEKLPVGLSMMCYTLGKENKAVLGEIQLRGRMGKLLYCLCQTASCLAKSSKE